MRPFAAVLALALCANPTPACEKFALPPTGLPEGIVAFEGTVEGFLVETVAPGGRTFEAPGLAVRVDAPLVGAKAGSAVRLIPLGTGLDCGPTARDARDVREQYPVGARVSVVARAAPGDVGLLWTQADDLGHVARIPDAVPRSEDGLLDFADHRRSTPRAEEGLASAWAKAHRNWFEDFEYVRALAALEAAASRESRVGILRRLGSYRRFCTGNEELGDRLYRGLLDARRLPRDERNRLRRLRCTESGED